MASSPKQGGKFVASSHLSFIVTEITTFTEQLIPPIFPNIAVVDPFNGNCRAILSFHGVLQAYTTNNI